MAMSLPVNLRLVQDTPLAYVVGNGDEYLRQLYECIRKVVDPKQAENIPDLPSSKRCCPGGMRESLVKMLLVIEV